MSLLTGEASLFGCVGIANGSSLQDDDRLLIGSERPEVSRDALRSRIALVEFGADRGPPCIRSCAPSGDLACRWNSSTGLVTPQREQVPRHALSASIATTASGERSPRTPRSQAVADRTILHVPPQGPRPPVAQLSPPSVYVSVGPACPQAGPHTALRSCVGETDSWLTTASVRPHAGASVSRT